MWLTLLLSVQAAELPGVALPFDVDPAGRWVLPAELPPAFAKAGVEPGWALTAVDGLKLAEKSDEAARIVATGPARNVRLHFDTPQGETIVVVPRGPLVVVEEIGLLPPPAGFAAGPNTLRTNAAGALWIVDGAGVSFALNPATGAQTKVTTGLEEALPYVLPELWWSLAEAPWVLMGPGGLWTGDRAAAQARLEPAGRIGSFQGAMGDHLVVPSPEGLAVHRITWPQGTPSLPTCTPAVPEACLVSGRQIAATFLDKPGGRDLALIHFGYACEGGTYRACLEAVALQDPPLAAEATACAERDVNACHVVGKARLAKGKDDALLIGTLEHACAVDASGSLGERLRRQEEVGEGCLMAATAWDAATAPDRALLSLDQACVLGRVEACESAALRRQEAFALKTVAECEDPRLPLGSACVQLGKLRQQGPVKATKLDDFAAFQRACTLGEEEGCVLLGDYVDRWGIDHPRVSGAERALRKACEKGEQRACVGQAHLLVRHEPRSEAYGQALVLFDKACTEGIATACIAGAEQRRIGAARKVEAPPPEALWTAACTLDSAAGCAGLGERLSREKRDWDAAYTAWTKACDIGEASACTDLGRFVTHKHDPAWPGEQPSADYLRRGCESGDPAGCFYQASLDIPRKGEPPEAAYLLLARSCTGDFGEGCAELGEIHLGRDTSFDDEIAAGHLKKACENGHFESCKVLGEMYQRGKGVEKDRAKAKEMAQRYSINADRRHIRLGGRVGFPTLAGGEGELVAPIPVGPALAVTASGSFIPGIGGLMVQLKGDTAPDVQPDLRYLDAGLRLYPNNKARGLYGMVGVHELQASGGELNKPLARTGVSARLGMYSEDKLFYSRLEMGIGQYGMINLRDFDDDETGRFPLVQATLSFSFGLAVL